MQTVATPAMPIAAAVSFRDVMPGSHPWRDVAPDQADIGRYAAENVPAKSSGVSAVSAGLNLLSANRAARAPPQSFACTCPPGKERRRSHRRPCDQALRAEDAAHGRAAF